MFKIEFKYVEPFLNPFNFLNIERFAFDYPMIP
jgi:hypothetical protein